MSAPPAVAPPPSLGAFLLAELRGAARAFARRTLRVGLVAALLTLALLVSGGLGPEGLVAATLVVYLAVALAQGLVVGLAVATFALLWRLFGAALLLVLILAPLLFLAVLALLGPWIVDLGQGVIGAWIDALLADPATFRSPPIELLRGFAHAGQAALIALAVLALPILVYELGHAIVVLVTPPVLWPFLGLCVAVLVTLALALALALAVSLPILAVALVRRFRRRRAAAAGSSQ